MPELVALLMFLAALRIGHKNAIGALQDLPKISALAAFYQVAIPLLFLVIFTAISLIETPIALAIILMAAASPISGAPNLAIMVKADPAPALRLLIISTALLPITVLPILYWLPIDTSASDLLSAWGRLLALIVGASVCAFAIRARYFKMPTETTIAAMDGCSALVMAVLVIGLMSAVGATLYERPIELMQWLAIAFMANYGLQLLGYLLLGKTNLSSQRAPLAICAGNRNIALFLVVLPTEIIAPILLFIGCYQVPMYLTPVLLRKLYAN